MTNTTTAKKAPLWTTAQITAIETAFEKKKAKLNNADVMELVENDPLFANKTENMLRSKVVNLGYYEKAVKKSVGSAENGATRKIEYVAALETLASMQKGSLASFEKASKPQLEAFCKALTSKSDVFNAEKGIKEPQTAK